MSEHSDMYWVSFAEKFFGLLLIIIGAVLLYYTATTSLGQVLWLFALVSIVILALGIFLLLVKPPQ